MTVPMADHEVRVERVADPGHEHVAALARLLPQLSSSAPTPDRSTLDHLCDPAGSARLFAARLASPGATPPAPHRPGDTPPGEGPLVGFALLLVFSTLTGTRGLVEDVVVDEAARNHGVGTSLVEHLVRAARDEGCRTLDLTSRPSREAANRLYARCGFVRRDTNVWRHPLDPR